LTFKHTSEQWMKVEEDALRAATHERMRIDSVLSTQQIIDHCDELEPEEGACGK